MESQSSRRHIQPDNPETVFGAIVESGAHVPVNVEGMEVSNVCDVELYGLGTNDTPENPPTIVPLKLGKGREFIPVDGQKPKDDEAPHSSLDQSTLIFGFVMYAACSSTLLVVNKVSMNLVPNAGVVLLCQVVASVFFVRTANMCGIIDVELLEWVKVRKFFPATLIFYLCLLSNTAALRTVNVDTVIVVRSCSPIAVAALNFVALGKPLPSLQSCFALCALAAGAVMYCILDEGFHIHGYTWLLVYFITIVVEMVFVKFIMDTVEMSTWTRVYYNNALSIPLALGSLLWDRKSVVELKFGSSAVVVLSLSCLIGVGISYAGFNLRQLTSATSFSVAGVVCKIFTMVLNDVIWTKHSGPLGHAALFTCLCAGFVYEKLK